MVDTDESKQEPIGTPEEPEMEIDAEEGGGMPGWISWILVIAGAVLGGYMLGAQYGAAPTAGIDATKLKVEKVKMQQDLEAIKNQAEQDVKRAIERADQKAEQLVAQFCREMIRRGLFRDGLEKELDKIKADLSASLEQLAKADAKPEARVEAASKGIKAAQEHLTKVREAYDVQQVAQDKVAKIGTVDDVLDALKQDLIYLLLIRFNELTPQAQAGQATAKKELIACYERISRLDPKVGQALAKQSPLLSGKTPTAAPAPEAEP